MTRTPPTRQAQGAERRRVSQPRLMDIIPHLRNARRLRDGSVLASCPVPTHGRGRGDLNPSLHLWEEGGELHACCYAGCDARDVWRELRRLAGQRGNARTPSAERQEQPESQEPEQGLTLEAYARAKQLPIELLRQFGLEDCLYNGQPAVKIPFWDADGELRAVQYRLSLEGSDRFRWRRGDAPRLYGEWRVSEWLSQGEATLWAVEGCSDTLTMWCAGYACLALPSASSTRLASDFWQIAHQFERVVLCFDSDRAGSELLEAVADACPRELRERAFGVQLPNDTKDLSELWCRLSGNADAFREQVRQLAAQAEPITKILKSLKGETFIIIRLGDLRAQRGNIEREWLPLFGREGLIARGSLVMIGGSPKTGKSTLLVHAAREWLQRGERILVWSEERPDLWLERVERFPELSELFYVGAGQPVQPVLQAAGDAGVSIIVLDSLRSVLGFTDENDASCVQAALEPLLAFARDNPSCTQVWLHHTRKGAREEVGVEDLMGSMALAAAADCLMVLHPFDAQEPYKRVLRPLAGRYWLHTPEPLVIELAQDGSEYRALGSLAAVAPELRNRQAKDAVLGALMALGEASIREIHEYVSERQPLSEVRVRQVIEELMREGYVEASSGTGRRGAARTFIIKGQAPMPFNYFSNPPSPADDEPTPLVRVSDDELEQFARLLNEPPEDSGVLDEFTLWASML